MEINQKNNFSLDEWQLQILEAEGNILLCTGRQVGKTLVFAIKAAEKMINNPGTRIIAVSLTEDQAYLMRSMVEDYLEKNYKHFLKVPKKDKPTKNQIKLSNKSSYTVRPVGQTGNALRGFTGDVLIVDEAAFMPEIMWAAAKPTLLTTAGKIWMCSTPNVKEGWFYEQFHACYEAKTSERFKCWHVSSDDVIQKRKISDSWSESKRYNAIKFLEDERKSMSTLRYGQEYLGLFMEDLMRVFPDEWIAEICTQETPKHLIKGEYYLGVDIARYGGDETAFEIIHKQDKDKLIHIHDEHKTETSTTWTEDKIIDFNRLYSLEKIYIDAGAGSLGVGIYDQLLDNDETKFKVEAINNRKIIQGKDKKDQRAPRQRLLKEDLYDNLYRLGERKEIKLLDNDAVRASLRSVTKEIITNDRGLSRINIKGTYDHIAEALIRAAWCSKEKDLNFVISSIKI